MVGFLSVQFAIRSRFTPDVFLRVTELDQEELNFPGSEEMTKFIEAKRRELHELKDHVDYEEALQ